ncbi:helix-turn-helix transcriptional regulator [Actinokineospora globicatena]|uniref:Transcriptional regulator, AraC family protein n=1 Tax=Actinokineospora globicatena TaxID=103729 RepID=A0A9W6QRF5_9PSEU|nr:AraC family transcriptional regulator [Actinokineospora globicatena]GLW93234.1 putative transcriptional regulator, AraC family protein [Actinokineospora globicatena]
MAGDWDGGFGAIGPGWQLYVGAVGEAAEHAHHAIQIVLADSPIVLRDAAGRQHPSTAALIPANMPHAIVSGSGRAAMLYLEPESTTGRALGARFTGDTDAVGTWAEAARDLSPALLTPGAEPDALVTTVLDALGLTGPHNPVHPAVERAIRHLPTVLDGPVRLAEVAAVAGLSASRLSHLFADEIGLSFRRYVLWLRLRRAVESVLGGATLTEAAHAAGFTDSAHLTNVTRRTFGLAPSRLAKAVAPVARDRAR